jgi:hypothetical protein
VSQPLSNHLCRIPSRDCEGGHISAHHTASSHHSTFADGDAGQNDRPEANPHMITNDHGAAAISEGRRAGVVAEGEDRRLRADAHIRAHSDWITAAIQQAAVIDDASLPKVNAGAMQKPAVHLHATAGAKVSQPAP